MSSLFGTFADSLCQVIFVRSLRGEAGLYMKPTFINSMTWLGPALGPNPVRGEPRAGSDLRGPREYLFFRHGYFSNPA